MNRKILPLLMLLMGFALALAAAIWENHFFPPERVEILNPAGHNHRVFTRSRGFGDTSIELYASDWPHSFTKPIELGDIYSEGFPVYRVHWSGDGSVIGVAAIVKQGSPAAFQAAYDFKAHKAIRKPLVMPAAEYRDEEITSLMGSRGGIGDAVAGIDDGKGTGREKFPAWGWFPPPGILALFAGIAAAIRSRIVRTGGSNILTASS